MSPDFGHVLMHFLLLVASPGTEPDVGTCAHTHAYMWCHVRGGQGELSAHLQSKASFQLTYNDTWLDALTLVVPTPTASP